MSVVKQGNIKKMNNFSIVLISGLLTLIIGSFFMVLYWIGEQFDFAPVITLLPTSWLTTGEAVIMYIILLFTSIFIGSFIVLHLLKRFS